MIDFRLAVKAFILDDSDNLLIVKRDFNDVQKPNIWEIPGGRLELGEDPIKGLLREVKEETNLDIEVLHPFNVRHFTRSDNQVITMIIFLCKAKSVEVKLSDEHLDFDWISLNECKDKLNEFFHEEVDIFNKLNLKKIIKK